MLKTNSKKARENLRQYIREHLGGEDYDNRPDDETATFPEIARFILETFRSEKYSTVEDYQYYRHSEIWAFLDWCAGLPSVLDTCYYYNRSAVDDLGAILEESESEKARFTESEAERVLTNLIYNELVKAEAKK